MISSATALIYFKSAGRPVLLHSPDSPQRAAWGMPDAAVMRWFGAHGFRVDWSKGTAALAEGRGALQRYVQTWIEIGAVERAEIIEDGYLTKGLIWHDLKGWEREKVEKLQKILNEEKKQ